MNKYIIIIIYIISIFIVIATINIFLVNDNINDIRYSFTDEELPDNISKILSSKNIYNNYNNIVAIYYVKPLDCYMCIVDIHEYNSLLEEELNIPTSSQLLIFNMYYDIQDVARYMDAFQLDLQYEFGINELSHLFLSKFKNTEDNDQIIVIDKRNNRVVLRALLENYQLPEYEYKMYLINSLKIRLSTINNNKNNG